MDSFLFSDNSNPELWFPFNLAKEMNEASPANIGKLIKPQNKQNEQKFWGTNLCFEASFPEHSEAQKTANRLAFFGYNAVRLHHMDFFFEPKGIFKDVNPLEPDSELKPTGILSENQLDKLDFLISKLKEKNITVNMNLLVSRHFSKADKVMYPESLKMGAKPMSLFDRNLINLQKKYAKDLFLHKNKYTGFLYAADPAISMVEITNENSILSWWEDDKLNIFPLPVVKGSMHEYYMNLLDTLWNEWLMAKYLSAENAEKNWGVLNLEKDKNINIAWDIYNDPAAFSKLSKDNGTYIITIPEISGTNWHIQLKSSDFSIYKNKKYLLKFRANSASPRTITVVAQENFPLWNNLGFNTVLNLNINPEDFAIPFTVDKDCAKACIDFILGDSKNAVTISGIELKEISSLEWKNFATGKNIFRRPIKKYEEFYSEKMIEDIKTFYVELEKKYFDEMTDFLKNECGVMAPITGIGGALSKYDSKAQENCDYLDFHIYWDHPKFSNDNWDKNDFKMDNESILINNGFENKLKSKMELVRNESTDKPVIISEWDHCYPNDYTFETPLFIASYARNNNVRGLFHFAYSHENSDNAKYDTINSYFDSISNPLKLILNSLGSLAFLESKDLKTTVTDKYYKLESDILCGISGQINSQTVKFDNIQIKSENEGALFFYSTDNKPINQSNQIVFISLSGVKNTNSLWLKENYYDWGKAPVLLKKMKATIKFTGKHPKKIYGMNQSGTLEKEVRIEKTDGLPGFQTQEGDTIWHVVYFE